LGLSVNDSALSGLRAEDDGNPRALPWAGLLQAFQAANSDIDDYGTREMIRPRWAGRNARTRLINDRHEYIIDLLSLRNPGILGLPLHSHDRITTLNTVG
jgi:hypothetical protein